MTPISVLIPIADIGELEEHQYVGLISDSSQAHLEARLLEEGLLSPIWVRRNGNAARHRFSVIAGRHRLRAAKTLGWVEIAAAVKAGPSSSAAELKRLQLIENLDRRVMRPIERACFIMERWNEVAHKLPECGIGSQQSEAARARWSASLTLSNARREGAADKLAKLLEDLNAVSKEAFGTTGGFAADRSTIQDVARDTIAKANQRIAEAQKVSDPALAETNAALDENNGQNAQIIAILQAFQAQLGSFSGVTGSASRALTELARNV